MKIVKRILLAVVTICVLFLGIIYFWGYKLNIYLVPPSPQKYVQVALNNMDELGLFTDSKEWVETKKNTIQEMLKIMQKQSLIKKRRLELQEASIRLLKMKKICQKKVLKNI